MMADRPIFERMDRALQRLAENWPRRKPKAFYLIAADLDEWEAAGREMTMVRVPFGNNPTVWRDERAYCDVPVRPSTGKASRLYDDTTSGHPL